MIDIEQISPHAHRIVLMGAFQQPDAEQLVEFAKQSLSDGGAGNVLIDLTSLADFSLTAVGEELVHIPALLKWLHSVDRIAVVSDEGWIRTAARFESLLIPGVTYQVYDEFEAEAARDWVLEETDAPHAGVFQEIEIENRTIAAFEISGRLDRDEAERGIELVRRRLEQPDCSRLMLVVKHWNGFEANVMFSEKVLTGKLSLIGELERYAIVGGPPWISTLAGVVGAMLKPEIRTFDLDQKEEAIHWLEG